ADARDDDTAGRRAAVRVQENGAAQVAAELALVGELLQLLLQTGVGARGRIVFGEDDGEGGGGPGARRGNLDHHLVHRGAMVSERRVLLCFYELALTAAQFSASHADDEHGYEHSSAACITLSLPAWAHPPQRRGAARRDQRPHRRAATAPRARC